ncbi:MAG: TetR/AcrR family transcriptional regulator [Pseudomonadota bacterium]
MPAKTTKTPKATNRDLIIDAFFNVVAAKGMDDVAMAEVAKEAGLKLSDVRDEFTTPYDILAAYARRVDRQVLDMIPEDLMEDTPRERVFDVLMMRFDALADQKEALGEMFSETRSNPLALAAWNQITIVSMGWMMTGVGLEPKGPAGLARAQGLVFVFARAFRVWLKDDDPGMARTMAELDRRLRDADRSTSMLNNLQSALRPLSFLRRRRRRFDYPTADQPFDDGGDPPARNEMH